MNISVTNNLLDNSEFCVFIKLVVKLAERGTKWGLIINRIELSNF